MIIFHFDNNVYLTIEVAIYFLWVKCSDIHCNKWTNHLLLFCFWNVKDTYWNSEEFPRSFFKGSWHGFWWSFISATTVG